MASKTLALCALLVALTIALLDDAQAVAIRRSERAAADDATKAEKVDDVLTSFSNSFQEIFSKIEKDINNNDFAKNISTQFQDFAKKVKDNAKTIGSNIGEKAEDFGKSVQEQAKALGDKIQSEIDEYKAKNKH